MNPIYTVTQINNHSKSILEKNMMKVFVKGIPVSSFGDGADMGQLIMGSMDVFAGR